jgi:chitinase
MQANLISKVETAAIPGILKHIGVANYITDVNKLANNEHRGSIVQAVLNWDKGKNPIGVNYIKQDPSLSMFLKDKYK